MRSNVAIGYQPVVIDLLVEVRAGPRARGTCPLDALVRLEHAHVVEEQDPLTLRMAHHGRRSVIVCTGSAGLARILRNSRYDSRNLRAAPRHLRSVYASRAPAAGAARESCVRRGPEGPERRRRVRRRPAGPGQEARAAARSRRSRRRRARCRGSASRRRTAAPRCSSSRSRRSRSASASTTARSSSTLSGCRGSATTRGVRSTRGSSRRRSSRDHARRRRARASRCASRSRTRRMRAQGTVRTATEADGMYYAYLSFAGGGPAPATAEPTTAHDAREVAATSRRRARRETSTLPARRGTPRARGHRRRARASRARRGCCTCLRSVPSSIERGAGELRVADDALGVLLAAGDEHGDDVRALGLRRGHRRAGSSRGSASRSASRT